MPFTRAPLYDNKVWLEKAYLPGMAPIAAGVLAAILLKRFGGFKHPRLFAAIGVLGIVGVLTAGGPLWKALRDSTLLLLIASTALLLVSLSARSAKPAVPGLLRSWGKLTYEIYLTHMFVVFTVVSAYHAAGGDLRTGYLWYLPLLIVAWPLGHLVARFYSLPAERWLRCGSGGPAHLRRHRPPPAR